MASLLHRRWLLLLLVAAGGTLLAGDLPSPPPEPPVDPEPGLKVQPTPFTVLLDFALLRHPAAHAVAKGGYPIWLEEVEIDETTAVDKTFFRLHLRPLPGVNDALLLRLFFDDHEETRPLVTTWGVGGERRRVAGPLGMGLGLPISESITLPVDGVALIEIMLPGDGRTLRQALLSTLQLREVATPLDFQPPENGAAPELFRPTPEDGVERPSWLHDTLLFGRVRALLEAGPIHLTPSTPFLREGVGEEEGQALAPHRVSLSFDLAERPLLAMVTLELLHADPTEPLELWINGEPVGAVALQLPDLADPAYHGKARPLRGMGFHYGGWITGQKAISGRLLRSGENVVTFELPAGSGPVVIRSVELQLKNHWRKLDYTLSP